jgi:hypothetical protein
MGKRKYKKPTFTSFLKQNKKKDGEKVSDDGIRYV